MAHKPSPLLEWVEKEISQLSNSTLRLALLAIIKKHQNEGIYGYAIGEELSAATGGELDGTRATFYALLRRLEKDNLVQYKFKASPSGPARKYYSLTEKGEKACNAIWANWNHYYEILERLIENGN